MIHVIMGLKGSGKTKKLIDAINAAVAEANGDQLLGLTGALQAHNNMNHRNVLLLP